MAHLDPYTGRLGYRLAKHLLRRCSFNYTRERIEDFAQKMPSEAVSELLQPATLIMDEPLDYITGEPFFNSFINYAPRISNFEMKQTTIGWWLHEAANDETINSKMMLFLHGMFTVHADTGAAAHFFDHLALLRQFTLGNFRDLAYYMTFDNVMLYYLNGNQNTKNNPNENYAREFFELFTIGKGLQLGPGDYTNYTEDDIIAAAKVLTGFGPSWNRPLGQNGDPQYVNSATGLQMGYPRWWNHDTNDKTFSAAFGNQVITGQSTEQGIYNELGQFVDMVYNQVETAKNICRKLYRFFVSREITNDIEQNVIAPLATQLKSDNYQITNTLRKLLESKIFYDRSDAVTNDNIVGGMVKSPVELVLQTQTFFRIKPPHPVYDTYNHYREYYRRTLRDVALFQAGMDLFRPPSVAGYPAYYQEPNYHRNWFNGSTLIARYKMPEIFLTGTRVLAGGSNGGVQVDLIHFISNYISDPSDAYTVVHELCQFLLPEYPNTSRFSYYLNDIFLDNLPAFDWTIDWNDYLQHGNLAILSPLEKIFKALLSSQEYQLM